MAIKVFCGTPKSFCSGAHTIMNAGFNNDKAAKLHDDHEQAFACYSRYLVAEQQHKRVGSREFETPSGSILVLTKKSKFGAKMRMGKNQNKEGKRFMPQQHNGAIIG